MVEILEKVKSHFGTVDRPYYGPTYILPDGSLLNLDGRGHHSVVEHYLIENGKLVVDESVEIEEKYDEKTGLYDIEGGFDWCFDQFYDDNLSRPSTEFCESMRPSVQFTEPIQVGKEPAVVFHDADKFYELNNVK